MSNILRFLEFLKPQQMLIAWGSIFVGISAFAVLPLPLLYRMIMDNAIPAKDLKLLFGCIIGIIILLFTGQIAAFFQTYFFAKVREGAFSDLRSTIYQHLQKMSLDFLGEQQSGGLLSRITSDVDAAQFLLGENFAFILRDFIYAIGIVVILISIDWPIALLSALILPLFYIIYIIFGKKIFHLSLKLQQQQESLMGGMAESIAGTKQIQAIGVEDKHLIKAQERIKMLEKLRRELLVKNALANSTTVFISIFACLLIWGVGGLQVIFLGKTLGTIFAVYYCLMNLYVPISNVLNSNFQIQMSLAAAGRIFSILNVAPEITEFSNSTVLAKIPHEIIFENVSFSYKAKGDKVLKNINLVLEPEQIMGIVGPNGSGKSTLWHLLLRFYEVQEGRILIGGKEIKKITLGSLRNYIASVPQSDFLFNTSIYENILMGRKMSSQRLDEIIEESVLLEMLEKLPLGWDTIVGEGGMKLSGGQKQRIMLARALVNDPMILFMDEGMSQLDPAVEDKLLENFKERVKDGRMVILISHKVSSLKNVDKLVVINDGKVENQGTKAQLSSQDGFYKRMMELQIA